MGSQQSRLQNHHQPLQESRPSELTEKEKLEEKTKCWKFPNCHKFQNQDSEPEIYTPYSANLNTKDESSNLLNSNQTSEIGCSKPSNEEKNEVFVKNIKINNGPSIAAGAIVGTWKTGSLKRPDNLEFSNSQRSSGEDSTPLRLSAETPIVHDSTTSIYSDISSLRTEAPSEYFLSEHSQDMLMHVSYYIFINSCWDFSKHDFQIIRCFPFPSPKNSPKVIKKLGSQSSVYGPYCETEPSSSNDLPSPGVSPVKPKKHLFKKHGNPVSSFFHIHHKHEDKRKRTGSTVSENAVRSKKEENDSGTGTMTSGRPYAHSTTSAPGNCTTNGVSRGPSSETINGSHIRKGALSTLCQVGLLFVKQNTLQSTLRRRI